MEIIPAIDIRGGLCVRLYQGDYARETVYSEEPWAVAAQWVEMGASRLHIVDLDGARQGVPAHLALVERIAAGVGAKVQLGGGIRTVQAAQDARSAGVDRVIVGTAAATEPGFLLEVCQALGPEAVVAAIDARDGYLVVRGWSEGTSIPVGEAIRRAEAAGVRRIVYTDVDRDGTLTEPNFVAIERIARESGLRTMAAGGIASLSHLMRLARLGVEAAIVGKALYTGDVDLAEALDAVSGVSSS